MKTFVRLWRFNLVGAMGVLLQLATLSALNHFAQGHYLVASAIAVELAVLHNFAWHMQYTWRDRMAKQHWFKHLMRFHLTNGLISIIGNLLLMRPLVSNVHLPVMFSNLVAIVCCSVVNFTLSDCWTFRGTPALASPKAAAVSV